MNNEQEEMARYFSEIEQYPILTREEEHNLAQCAKNGDKSALDLLIVSNLRFVVRVAHTFSGYLKHGKVTLLDLVQEGNKGLVIATKKFDPDRGYRLISYSVWWIRVGMQKLVTNNFSLVKLGTTALQRKLFFKLGKITEILMEADFERKDKLREDLAEITKVSVKQIESMEIRVSWKDKSLSDTMVTGDGDPISLVDMLAERIPWQDYMQHRTNHQSTVDCIHPAIEKLTDREQLIINQRWLGPEKITLQEIGKQLGITRERVRQIEKTAIRKIKHSLKKQGILDSELG